MRVLCAIRKQEGSPLKKLLVLLVLILVGTAAWAQARTGSGQWLHDHWTNYQKAIDGTATDTEAVGGGVYEGFVMGAVRVMQEEKILLIPDSVTFGQWCVVVGKYLDDHPEKWNSGAEVLVLSAMGEVWPGHPQ